MARTARKTTATATKRRRASKPAKKGATATKVAKPGKRRAAKPEAGLDELVEGLFAKKKTRRRSPTKVPTGRRLRQIREETEQTAPDPEGAPWTEERLAEVEQAATAILQVAEALTLPEPEPASVALDELLATEPPVAAAPTAAIVEEDLFADAPPLVQGGFSFAEGEPEPMPAITEEPPPPRELDLEPLGEPPLEVGPEPAEDWPIPPGPAAVDISVLQAVVPVAARVDELVPRVQELGQDIDDCRTTQEQLSGAVEEMGQALDAVRVDAERDRGVIEQAQSVLYAGDLRWVLAGMAVLMLCWSIATYFKTGDARLAFWLLLASNALGCGAITFGRPAA